MPISTAGKAPSNQRGFSYAMVLAAVVVVGIVVEVAHVTTWRIVQAGREAELLYRGAAYRRAIESYHKANGSYPRSLEDLIKDPRSVSRRHLRALYADPMGAAENNGWSLVRAPDGGIAGVASVNRSETLKQANFPQQFEKFNGAKSYAEWIFEYVPPPAAARPQPAKPPAAPLGPSPIKTF